MWALEKAKPEDFIRKSDWWVWTRVGGQFRIDCYHGAWPRVVVEHLVRLLTQIVQLNQTTNSSSLLSSLFSDQLSQKWLFWFFLLGPWLLTIFHPSLLPEHAAGTSTGSKHREISFIENRTRPGDRFFSTYRWRPWELKWLAWPWHGWDLNLGLVCPEVIYYPTVLLYTFPNSIFINKHVHREWQIMFFCGEWVTHRSQSPFWVNYVQKNFINCFFFPPISLYGVHAILLFQPIWLSRKAHPLINPDSNLHWVPPKFMPFLGSQNMTLFGNKVFTDEII